MFTQKIYTKLDDLIKELQQMKNDFSLEDIDKIGDKILDLEQDFSIFKIKCKEMDKIIDAIKLLTKGDNN